MKKKLIALAVIALAMLIVAGSAEAQILGKRQINSSKAFANSTADTVVLGSSFLESQYITWYIYATDSVQADVYVDTREHGVSAWTQAYADSVKHATTGNKIQEILIRTTTLDRATGLRKDVRVRKVYRASGNGFTTPAISDSWNYIR